MPSSVMPAPRASAGGSRSLAWGQTIDVGHAGLRELLDPGPHVLEPAEAMVDLVVLDAHEQELHRVPVRLTSRARSAGRMELWGSGEGGRLSVHVALDAGGRLTLQFRVTDQPSGARETLRLLDVIRALVAPHGIAIVPAGSAPSPVMQLTRMSTPEPPPGLRSILEDLAEIEAALEERLLVPDTFTPSDRQDIAATAALLRGEAVSGTWDEARWPVTAAEARELRAGLFADGAEAQLDYETEWELAIADASYPVGIVRVVHEAAEIRGVEPAELDGLDEDAAVVITLGPRSSSIVRYRLVAVSPRDPGDELDQRWFWTEAWQAREHAVDTAVEAGQLTTFATGEDFLDHLDELDRSTP